MNWQPSIDHTSLLKRAQIIAQIRQFFVQKKILEVDVPAISQNASTCPNLNSIELKEGQGFLATSPEFFMKRLLAAFAQDIYYLGKAFRKAEIGAKHNPEFTMLEWYKVNQDYLSLANEVIQLLKLFFDFDDFEQIAYQDIFLQKLDINPFKITLLDLKNIVKNQINLNFDICETLDKTALLELLFSHLIEPDLGKSAPVVVFDFPKEQAMLAQTYQNHANLTVAKRFEVYFKGIELANGFQELACDKEQLARFTQDNNLRQQANLSSMPIDYNLINALKVGLPNCSGVAMGIDRLLMLILNKKYIKEVMAFDYNRA